MSSRQVCPGCKDSVRSNVRWSAILAASSWPTSLLAGQLSAVVLVLGCVALVINAILVVVQCRLSQRKGT